jgi:stage V sporulation protein AE
MVISTVIAFIVGGLVCVVGQLLFDVAKLTPAHTLSLLVVIGSILDGFGLYEPLSTFGAGQPFPLLLVSLTHGAFKKPKSGVIGF